MSIFFFDRAIIGGKSGGSAVMAGGYSHGRKVTHELKNVTKSYDFKSSEVVHEAILLPKDAPQWAVDRYSGGDVGAVSERLWNDVEKREQNTRARGNRPQQAAFYTISLPVELSREAQVALIESYARANLMTNGEIVDIAVHDKGDGNPHAHIIQTMRPLEENGFGYKIRNFDTARLQLLNERAAWAMAANKALEMEGHEARIDHRSNVARGLELVPGTTFNADIAHSVGKDGGIYRAKERSIEARAENERILMENPEHILMVLSQEKARFVVEDVEIELRRKLPPEVDAQKIGDLVGMAMASPEIIATGEVDYKGRTVYTTRTALEMGRMLTRSTLQMRDSEVDLGQADPNPEPRSDLLPEQRNAFDAMISPRRIEVIEGYAGTGKTHTLIEASKVWEDRGFAVYGSAVSGKAVQELSGLHGHVGTIAHFEQLWEAGGLPPQDKFVMFMDEASMVGVSTWARFQDRINEMGGVIRHLGDRAQTTPVNDASALAHVASLVGVTQVTDIFRQQGLAKDRGDREAIRTLSQGIAGVEPALRHFADQGALHMSETLGAAEAAIVEGFFEGSTPETFWSKGEQRLAVAHTNATVDSLNAALHEKAVELGFASGRAEDSIEISREREGKFSITISTGDRIRFTRAYSDADVSKNALGSVLGVSGTMMSVQVDGKAGPVMIDTAEMRDFDHGYAVTIHKSQGTTVHGKVFGIISGMMDWHLLDVLASRHVYDFVAHVASDTFRTDRGTLDLEDVIKQLSRSGLQNVLQADVAPTLRRAHPTLEEALAPARADRLANVTSAPEGIETVKVGLRMDTHLYQISQRTAGLLRGEYNEDRDPEFKADPRGYMVDPMKVVDDLLAETGVVRASTVASRLSEITNNPSTFTDLFYRAMSHPDLVILSESGIAGEGRVYSTLSHIDQSTSIMDQALRLAVQTVPFNAGPIDPSALSASPFGNGDDVQGGTAPQLPSLSERVAHHHAIIVGPENGEDGHNGTLGAGVAAYSQPDWAALRAAALEAKIVRAAHDNRLETDQVEALRAVFWPSRIGIIESVGADHTNEVIAGAVDVLAGGKIIAVHPSQLVGVRTAMAAGVDTHTLHSLGADLKEGNVTLGSGDILYVPEASGLRSDQLEIVMGYAEKTGAKLVLHRDPTSDGTGAVLRHLADRLPVAKVGGLTSIAPELQGLVQGGEALERSLAGLWAADQIIGAQSEKQQISGYVETYLASEAQSVVGLAASKRMRDTLNKDIEFMRREGAEASPVYKLKRGAYAAPLSISVGTQLVVTRDMPDHGILIGDRARVVSVADDGGFLLRFNRRGADEIVIRSGPEASSLEYGYVVSPQMARRTEMKAQDVHLFATRGLSQSDLMATVQLKGRLTVSLPTEVDLEGASKAFFERVLSRCPRGSVLDYGFDPSKALLAAGETYHAPSLEERLEISSDNRDVLSETKAVYRANPEFIVAELTRRIGRFDVEDLAFELRNYYASTEMDEADRLGLAGEYIKQFEADGTVVYVGRSDVDGTRRYTTRVQATLELDVLERGIDLANKTIEGLAPLATDDGRLAHVTGAERLSFAMLPASHDDQKKFYQDVGRVWRDRGYQVIAVDMSKAGSEAQAALLGEGTQAASWVSLDARWAAGRLPASAEKTVVVVSRAELLPPDVWARLQVRIDELGMKAIHLADEHDLPRTNALNFFKTVSREVGLYRDAPALIQTREADRIAATLIAGTQEDAARAIAIYDGLGYIHFAGARDAAMNSIARRYWSKGLALETDRLAFTHSKESASRLDAAIRKEGVRLGLLGQEFEIAGRVANIGQQLRIDTDLGPTLPAGTMVQLRAVTDGGITVSLPNAEGTHFIPKHQLPECRPDFARTLWDGTSIEVDKSFVLATYGMDQPLFKVALSRHRDDVEIHAATRDFKSIEAMQFAVSSTNSFYELVGGVIGDSLRPIDDPQLTARRDRSSPIYKTGVYAQDAHLQSVAQRVGALMSLAFNPSEPIIGEDPDGYAKEPRKVVDDILSQSSVLRAEDVARRLAGVVNDPQTFERLFAEAMTHPDLVILSETGRNGEGRIYSTLSQIKREIDLNDRVTALSLSSTSLRVSDGLYARARVTEHGEMTAEQERALRHVTSGARVSIIDGVAGSGKTTVFAGARRIYEETGRQAIGVTLTSDASRAFGEATGIQSRTLASLTYAVEQGRLSIGPKTTLIIDQAGALDDRAWDAVISLAEKSGASLALVDSNDHIQYGRGGMFRQWSQSLGACTLSAPVRQRNAEDAKAIEELQRGGDAALDAVIGFARRGIVTATGAERDLHLQSVVQSFSADQSADKVMLAYRRADVADLNMLARATDQKSRDPALAEHLVADADGNTLSVQAGDKIRVVVSNHAQGVYKGEVGEVAHVNLEAENYTLQLGKGDETRYVTLPFEGGPTLSYNYAQTIDSAAGTGRQSVHAVFDWSMGRDRGLTALSRHTDKLHIYAPTEHDRLADLMGRVLATDSHRATTLEKDYGFDPRRSAEALQVVRSDQTRLEDYLDANDVVAPRPTNRRLADLFKVEASRESLAPAAATRALIEVRSARAAEGEMVMDGALQHQATRLLQEVSEQKTWDVLSSGMKRSDRRSVDQVAQRWTGARDGEVLLPEARALARAIAYSDMRGTHDLSRVLKSGMEGLSASVEEARAAGTYEQMLKDAHAPVVVARDLAPVGQAISRRDRGPITDPYRSAAHQSRGFLAELKVISDREYARARERAEAANLAREAAAKVKDRAVESAAPSVEKAKTGKMIFTYAKDTEVAKFKEGLEMPIVGAFDRIVEEGIKAEIDRHIEEGDYPDAIKDNDSIKREVSSRIMAMSNKGHMIGSWKNVLDAERREAMAGSKDAKMVAAIVSGLNRYAPESHRVHDMADHEIFKTVTELFEQAQDALDPDREKEVERIASQTAHERALTELRIKIAKEMKPDAENYEWKECLVRKTGPFFLRDPNATKRFNEMLSERRQSVSAEVKPMDRVLARMGLLARKPELKEGLFEVGKYEEPNVERGEEALIARAEVIDEIVNKDQWDPTGADERAALEKLYKGFSLKEITALGRADKHLSVGVQHLDSDQRALLAGRILQLHETPTPSASPHHSINFARQITNGPRLGLLRARSFGRDRGMDGPSMD